MNFMKGKIIYDLLDLDNARNFLEMLRTTNNRYNLGLFREDKQAAASISAGSVEIGYVSLNPVPGYGLKVFRGERGKNTSLDQQVDNLIAIADAYPQWVDPRQLNGIRRW